MQKSSGCQQRLATMSLLVLVVACAFPQRAVAESFVRAFARVNVCPPRTQIPAPCLQDSESGNQRVEAAAAMSLTGPDGRIGEARARVDLSSGTLGVFAMAQGPNELFDFN